MSEDANLERHRLSAEKLYHENVEDLIDQRLRVHRELGFDRGVSVVCSLLLQVAKNTDDLQFNLKLSGLAMEYVANLMATPLGEKLASMDYEQREQIIQMLDPTKGTKRT